MADSSAVLTESVEPAEAVQAEHAVVEDAVVDDVLVEEVSIDGMCGVY